MKATHYVTYMLPTGPSNACSYHAGIGETPEESVEASLYWANQYPWTKTVAISRAPKWAVEEAEAVLRQRDAFARDTGHCPDCGEPLSKAWGPRCPRCWRAF